MSDNAFIRTAVKKDIPTLVKFNKSMAKETESLDLDENILTRGVTAVLDDPQKGFYLVYEIDGSVRGCLMITQEWSDWRNGTFWWIQSVYVEEAFRRRGLFQGLYEHVENSVKDAKDIAGLRLYVDAENIAAQKTYKNLGMKKTNYLLFETS